MCLRNQLFTHIIACSGKLKTNQFSKVSYIYYNLSNLIIMKILVGNVSILLNTWVFNKIYL